MILQHIFYFSTIMNFNLNELFFFKKTYLKYFLLSIIQLNLDLINILKFEKYFKNDIRFIECKKKNKRH